MLRSITAFAASLNTVAAVYTIDTMTVLPPEAGETDITLTWTQTASTLAADTDY